MVTKLLFGFRASNDCVSSGESLMQHVLEDPLLALGRADGASFVVGDITSTLASLIYRS